MYYSHEEKHSTKILILLITYSQITYPVNENGITVSIFQINRLYTTRQNLEQDEGKEEYMKQHFARYFKTLWKRHSVWKKPSKDTKHTTYKRHTADHFIEYPQ